MDRPRLTLSGVQSGSVEIPVAPDVPILDELLIGHPATDDEPNDDDIGD